MSAKDFLENIQNILGFDLNRIADLDEKTIQSKLAPILRELAVNYLRYSTDDTTAIFRAQFETPEDTEAYLNHMSQNNVWGQDTEARALANVLGVNLNVTVSEMVPNAAGDDWVNTHKTYPLVQAEDPSAPTFEFNNRENEHWFINDATESDGNCLFNSMAQALQSQVTLALQETAQEAHREQLSSDDETDHESFGTDTSSESSEDKLTYGLDDLKYRLGSRNLEKALDKRTFDVNIPGAVKKLAEFIYFHATSPLGKCNLKNPSVLEKHKGTCSEVNTVKELSDLLDTVRLDSKRTSLQMLDAQELDGSMSTQDVKHLKQEVLHASTLYAADDALANIKQYQHTPVELKHAEAQEKTIEKQVYSPLHPKS